MSFYLVNQPLNTKIYIPDIIVVFSRVIYVEGYARVLAIISSKGILRVYSLNMGQLLQQFRLQHKLQAVQALLNVEVCSDLIIMMSFKNFYLLKLSEIVKQVKKAEKLKVFGIKKIAIVKKGVNITTVYTSKLNKYIKIVKNSGKYSIKLSGRARKQISYCYGVLEEQTSQLSIESEWQGEFNYEYKVSLQSLNNNFLIYQSYCNKGKPIKLSIVESISSIEHKNQFLVQALEVNHFYQQITVVDVALLNSEVLCIFGNNCHQEVKSSLMVLYNVRQKFTLNYLNFKEATIEKIFWFHHKNYEFAYNYSLAQFDAVQIGDQGSRCYQIFPQSYQTDQKIELKGKVLSCDRYFILTKDQGQIRVYPKIHKTAIYYQWMNFLGVHQPQILSMAAELLQ